MTIDLFPEGCPVCERATDAEDHCVIDQHKYISCCQCGLIYQTGQTTEKDVLDCYEGGALKNLRRSLLNRFRKIENQRDFDLRMSRAREIFKSAQSKTEGTPGNYLDIGCNKGFNIYAAEEMGWNGFGNELVEEIIVPITNSKPHLKDKIICGSFVDLSKQYESDFFDLITCIDVIEHLLSPKFALQEILRILKPGGVAVFQTPEVDDETFKMKENWAALKPNEHLVMFSRSNFKILLEKVGFQDIDFAVEPFEVCDGNFVVFCKKPVSQ